jgi:hypothetical protein
MVASAGIGIGLELGLACFRRWLISHPFTVALGAGLIVVALTLLGVERVFGIIESRRWRSAALVALDHYVFSVDRAVQAIYERINEIVRALPQPPAHDPGRVGLKLELILEQRPEAFEELSDFIREQADALGSTAMVAASTVARHEPYAEMVRRIFLQQQRLGDAAQMCHGLLFTATAVRNSGSEKLKPLLARYVREVEQLLEAVVDDIHTIRLQVMEAREDDGSPAMRVATVKS